MRLKPTVGKVLAVAAIASALSACSAIDQSDMVTREGAAADAAARARAQAFADQVAGREARRALQMVDKPWIVGKPQPISRDVTLPPALRENVETTMYFQADAVDLQVIADRVSMATGIPVTVTPDALLPREMFLPRLGGKQADSDGITVDTSGFALSRVATLPSGTQPIAAILDTLTRRLGVYWKYDDATRSIVIFRTETRALNVRAISVQTNLETRVGRSTAGEATFQNTANSGFTQGTTAGSATDAVTAKLAAFMTRSGLLVSAGNGTNSVVITDTKEALDRIEAFLETENRALTRRILLVMEEIRVEMTAEQEAGVDWTAVYRAAGSTFGFNGPGAAASALAGSLSTSVGRGPFAGTTALVNMLSRHGTVVSHTRQPIFTRNRQPFTQAISQRSEYPNKLTTTALGTSSGSGTGEAFPQISIEQREITTGLFFTLLPDAQGDGQIGLSYVIDNTTAQPLRSRTYGTGGNTVTIESATIDGDGVVHHAMLQAGVPTLLTSYESDRSQSNQRRVNDGAPLLFGGGTGTSSTKKITLYVVTAQVQEGL